MRAGEAIHPVRTRAAEVVIATSPITTAQVMAGLILDLCLSASNPSCRLR